MPAGETAGCRLPARLVRHGGYILAGTPLQCRTDERFVPASILKLATVLGVLHRLGPDYRCVTRFVQDDQDNLLLEGRGDPLLTSEELALVLETLRRQGLRRINHLLLDDRYFSLEEATPGGEDSLNPYDAPNGALAVNFNTVHIVVGPDGQVCSAEEQTPTLPLMRDVGRRLPPGRQRVNLGAPALAAGEDVALRHAGQLLRALQQRAGIEGEGDIRRGSLSTCRQEYCHQSSRTLRDLARSCLAYSSNYTANQLLLILGSEQYGPPATWDKGRRALRESLTELLGEEQVASMRLVDGAGLSRANLVSPASMLAVLEALRPHADLLPLLDGDLVKSGTMTGVSSYAGYLGPRRTPFVLMLNQDVNTRDLLLGHLRRWVSAAAAP